MTTKLGRLAQTWLTLLACVLVVCVPGGTVRLKICDHQGVVVNPQCAEQETGHGATQPVATDSCCASEPSPHGDSHREDGDEPPTAPRDSCCTDVPTPNLLVHGDGGPKAADGDVEPHPELGAAAALPRLTEPRRQLARATGPPGDGHHALRHVAERATIVLLI